MTARHWLGSASSRLQGKARIARAIRFATADELAAMTRRDIMSKREPAEEDTLTRRRGGYSRMAADLTPTLGIHDDTSCFLDDDGRGGDVPTVHPHVIVDVSSARGNLAHVHRRSAQRAHPATPSQPSPQTTPTRTDVGPSHPCTGSLSNVRMLEVMVDRARSSRSAPISVTTRHLLTSDWSRQKRRGKLIAIPDAIKT